jgi:hypothetical protein
MRGKTAVDRPPEKRKARAEAGLRKDLSLRMLFDRALAGIIRSFKRVKKYDFAPFNLEHDCKFIVSDKRQVTITFEDFLSSLLCISRREL